MLVNYLLYCHIQSVYCNVFETVYILQNLFRNTSYLYNDEFKESPITLKDVNTILECWSDGKHRSGLKKVKTFASQIGVRKI